MELLQNMIGKCFQPDSPDQIKKYVDNRYDDNSGQYDERLLTEVARRAKRAATKKRKRISWDKAKELAIVTLDHARNAPPGAVQELIDDADY